MRQEPMPSLQALQVRTVRVPPQHLHQTASGAVSESPLVLTEAVFDDGTVGHSVVCTYTPAALKPTAELILISEEDWNAISETLNLLAIPGKRESIKEGMKTPASECAKDIDW